MVQRFLAKRRVDPLMMGGVEGFHKEKEGIRIRSIVAWCISVVVVLPSCISGLQERAENSIDSCCSHPMRVDLVPLGEAFG